MELEDYKAIVSMINDKYKEEHKKGIMMGACKVAVEDEDINIKDMQELLIFTRGLLNKED